MINNPQNLIPQIRKVRFFNNLSDKHLSEILNAGQIIQANPGDILFHEEQPCAGLYVLLKGQAHLKKFGPQGQQNIVHLIEPPFVFNEVSVADGGNNPVTAFITQPAKLWRIGYAEFEHLTDRFPPLARALLQVLATHNRLLLSEYEDLCFLPVRARLAKFLLDNSNQGNEIIDRKEVSIQMTAARISTAPELVSRALGFMRNNGYIEADRNQITIKSSEALAQIAQLNPEK